MFVFRAPLITSLFPFRQTSCGSAVYPLTTKCCSMGMWRRVPTHPPWRVYLSSVRRKGLGLLHLFSLSVDAPYLGSALGHSGQPNLLSTVPVADIRALLMGKDCPHVREKGSGKQNKVTAVGSEATPPPIPLCLFPTQCPCSHFPRTSMSWLSPSAMTMGRKKHSLTSLPLPSGM